MTCCTANYKVKQVFQLHTNWLCYKYLIWCITYKRLESSLDKKTYLAYSFCFSTSFETKPIIIK